MGECRQSLRSPQPHASCVRALASANTWTTPDGATVDGLPVAASASVINNFNTTCTITLTNLEANPTRSPRLSVASPSRFKIRSSQSPPFYQGDAVTVGANGAATYNPGAIYREYLNVPSPWVMTYNKSFTAAIVSASSAAFSLIGPPGPDGTYSNANGSIAGNGAHNPFATSLVWSFELIPITGDTGPITGVSFSFLGNGAASTIAGIDPPGPDAPSAVPGPIIDAGLPGLIFACVGLLALARRRQKFAR